MIPLILYIGTIAAAGITLASQLTSSAPKQGGGGSKRHTRKRTVKLTNSRKRR